MHISLLLLLLLVLLLLLLIVLLLLLQLLVLLPLLVLLLLQAVRLYLSESAHTLLHSAALVVCDSILTGQQGYVGFMLSPILLHAVFARLLSILMLLLDTLLTTTGSDISSLWVTVRKPKDNVTGVASGLHPWHADRRVNDHCVAFTFSAAGGTTTASAIQYRSGDSAVEPLTVTSQHGGIRIYTPALHFSKAKQPPVLHQVPANESDYAVVTVLIEGGGGTMTTPDDLPAIAAAVRQLPLPPVLPALTVEEYAGLCCISKQVGDSLLRGHRTRAERSLGGDYYPDIHCYSFEHYLPLPAPYWLSCCAYYNFISTATT